jgi:hypothetical protein
MFKGTCLCQVVRTMERDVCCCEWTPEGRCGCESRHMGGRGGNVAVNGRLRGGCEGMGERCAVNGRHMDVAAVHGRP